MTVDDIFDALYLQAKDEVGLSKLRDIVLTDESINRLQFNRKGQEPIEFIKVVRCKDCKHRPIPNGIDHPLAPELDGWSDYVCPCLCDDEYYNFMPDDNDYCSWGERREDADSDTCNNDI